jgi:two-component system, OmpR family, response regulator ResD
MAARILVVDDDDGIRRLVSTVLRRERYETEEAANGEEAIDKLDAAEYDAMFLDLMMPIRNGYEVLAHLRERQVARKCVIVMTAAGRRGTRDLDQTLVHRVLHKPFDIQDVVTAAALCIGRDEA